MQKIIILLLVFFLSSNYNINAQSSSSVTAKTNTSHSQKIEAGTQKTTHLIFAAAIKAVDRGSEQILVQKTTGVENVLKIKAAKPGFTETNLTVITADGGFYSFTVSYNPRPATFTYNINTSGFTAIGTRSPALSRAVFSEPSDDQGTLRALAAQASISQRNITGVRDKNYQVRAGLYGLYTAKDMFFYKLVLKNKSAISYDIEGIRFYIRDKKQVKRMATQEITLDPLMVIGNASRIAPGREEMLIIVLPKQTIGRDKQLVIEVSEKNGGRHLRCLMNNQKLLLAEPISVSAAIRNNTPYQNSN